MQIILDVSYHAYLPTGHCCAIFYDIPHFLDPCVLEYSGLKYPSIARRKLNHMTFLILELITVHNLKETCQFHKCEKGLTKDQMVKN